MSSAPNPNPAATTARAMHAIPDSPSFVHLVMVTALLFATPAIDARAQGGKPMFDHAVQTAGSPPAIEAIRLPSTSTYIAVHERSRTLPVRLRTRGRCDEDFSVARAELELAGSRLEIPQVNAYHYGRDYSGNAGKAWRTHQFDLDATQLKLWTGGKPLAENKPLPRLTAWQMCNEELSRHDGEARKRMLGDGFTLRRKSALGAKFRMQCDRFYTTKKAGGFEVPHIETRESLAQGGVDIEVKCLKAVDPDAPKPSRKTTTTGAPPRHGKPMPPSIASVKLRAEMSTHQPCPDSVRLVGDITAGRAGSGIYLFVGNYWLSPKGEYDFRKSGDHRSVVATRKLDWSRSAKDVIAAAPRATRTLEGWVQLNVQPQGTDKLYTSGQVPFKVTCRPGTTR